MQRILDPARIEAFAHRSIPRIRLPNRVRVFTQRAERLRMLATQPVGQPIADYLRLMGALADAQQSALAHLATVAPDPTERAPPPKTPQLPAAATEAPRPAYWRAVLVTLCEALISRREFPPTVSEVCQRLRSAAPAELEAQADALLATPAHAPDASPIPPPGTASL